MNLLRSCHRGLGLRTAGGAIPIVSKSVAIAIAEGVSVAVTETIPTAEGACSAVTGSAHGLADGSATDLPLLALRIVGKLPLVEMLLLLVFEDRCFGAGAFYADDSSSAEGLAAGAA